MKITYRVLELWAALRFNNYGRKLQKRSQLELSFLYAPRLLYVPYILVKYHENISKGFRVMVCTKFHNFGRLWEITPEPSRLELSFSHAPLLPNALYNLTKFHENSSKGIRFMGHTSTDGWTDGRQGDCYIPRTFRSWDKNSRLSITEFY